MLTGITLENFKAFKEPQFIRIKPITLVFGPNSAGKSSIIQALAFLKHVNDTEGNCDPMTVDYGGESIYLGSWNNLVYGHDKSATMRISLHFESCCIRWSFGWREHGARIASFDFFNKAAPSKNDEPIARGSNTGSTYINWSVELHSKHPFWEKYKSLIWKSLSECYHAKQNINDGINSDSRTEKECQVDQNKLSRISIESLESAFISAYKKWIMTGWRKIPDPCDGSHEYSGFLFPGLLRFFHGYVYPTNENPNFTIESMLERSSNSKQIWFEYRGDIAEENRAKEFIARFISSCESANADISIFDNILCNVHMAEESILERSNVREIFSGDYESPVTRPQHVSAFRKVTDVLLWRNVSTDSKSRFWKTLFNNSSQCGDSSEDFLGNLFHDFYGVNSMLKQIEIPYSIETRIVKTVAFKPGEIKFEDLSNAEIHHSDIELVCVDEYGKSHSLLSVGSGVSVILPLIMALSKIRKNFTSIEEPESHIHPRLQANLADIIISSTKGKTEARTLIETHSEHMILRILRRIRETTEKDYTDWPDDLIKACPNGLHPGDVSVLYVEPAKAGEEGAKVIELPVTLDGDFSRPWPGGFFAERSKELF